MKSRFGKGRTLAVVGATIALAVGCSVVSEPAISPPAAAPTTETVAPACSTNPPPPDSSMYAPPQDPLYRVGAAAKEATKAADAAKAPPGVALAPVRDETLAAQAAFLERAARLRATETDDARYEKARAELKAATFR